MATISFACGGEAASEPGTTSHWTTLLGSVAQSATHVKSGSNALKFTTSTTSDTYVGKDLASAHRQLVVRFQVFVPSLPGGSIRFLQVGPAWRNMYLNAGSGYLELWTEVSLATLPLNQWVLIEVRIDSSANPWTYEWRINGVAQPTASEAIAAADLTTLILGDDLDSLTGFEYWVDDFALSYVSGDYPIGDGAVTGSAPEVWTPASTVPVWTTPADTVPMSTTPELKFNSPVTASTQHFYLELDTANTFNTGSLRTYRSDESQTNWNYWDGSAWQAMPSGGMPANKSGNEVRYTVTTPLASGTWYRRVRASI